MAFICKVTYSSDIVNRVIIPSTSSMLIFLLQAILHEKSTYTSYDFNFL